MVEIEWKDSDIFERELFDCPTCAEFGCDDCRKEQLTVILPKPAPVSPGIFMVRVIRFIETDEKACIKKDFF